MGNKLIFAASLCLLWLQSASATVISMSNGNFYSKVESSYSNDSSGIDENSFEQTYMDDVPFSHMFSYDKDSIFNQSVTQESGFNTLTRNFGTPDEQNFEENWIRGIYEASSGMPSTPYTSSLFDLWDTTSHTLEKSLTMFATNTIRTNVDTGENEYYKRLSFSYVLTGSIETVDQGITTFNNFNYFLNVFLNFPPPLSASDLIGVDANTVDKMLRDHDGKYVTVSEGVNASIFSTDNRGFFESSGFSTMYVGSGIANVQSGVASVSEPGILALFILAGSILLSRRIKR